MRSGASGYRGDIDGLRALAIIPVVAFHAGVPGFGGGFVGVDVFFVISGFLITGLLLSEVRGEGRVRLFDFYARRVRRLLPALTLVALCSAVAGFFLLSTAGDQQRLGRSLVACAGFVSNVLFWRQQGSYFSPDGDVQPLLHTWTLAVEEQFYLVWPIGLIALAWLARRRRWRLEAVLAVGLALGAAASFGLGLFLMRGMQAAAFYLSPPRAWELALGALVALPAAGRSSRMPAAAAGALGLAALAYAVSQFDGHTLFPDVAALVPTLGAGMLIWAGTADPANPVSLALGWRPLRAVGRWSYSWYLWHWPLLAFGRVGALGERDLARDAVLAVAALGLAALTYVFVEQPIRLRKVWPFASVRGALLAGLAMLVVTAAAGASIWLRAHASESAMDRRILAVQASYGPLEACHFNSSPRLTLPPVARCSLGDRGAAASVLLWGDSFAQHLAPGLEKAGADARVRVIERSGMGCRTYRDAPRDIPSEKFLERKCIAFNRQMLVALPDLQRTEGLRGVILASQWRSDPLDGLAKLAAQADTIAALGLKVAIVLDPPGGRLISPTCLAYRAPDQCRIGRSEFERDRAAERAAMEKIAAANPRVRLFDPAASLCSGALCPASSAGEPLYRDNHHLSRAAAERLSAPLAEALTWLTQP